MTLTWEKVHLCLLKGRRKAQGVRKGIPSGVVPVWRWPLLSAGRRKQYPLGVREYALGAELPLETHRFTASREGDGSQIHVDCRQSETKGQTRECFIHKNSCLLCYCPVLHSIQHMLFINLCGWKPPKKDIF